MAVTPYPEPTAAQEAAYGADKKIVRAARRNAYRAYTAQQREIKRTARAQGKSWKDPTVLAQTRANTAAWKAKSTQQGTPGSTEGWYKVNKLRASNRDKYGYAKAIAFKPIDPSIPRGEGAAYARAQKYKPQNPDDMARFSAGVAGAGANAAAPIDAPKRPGGRRVWVDGRWKTVPRINWKRPL